MVRAFLEQRFDTATGVVPLQGGEWSQAFAFHADGRDLVIRFGQFIGDYEKDRVAGSWRQSLLPVPEVLDLGEAFDGVYAVSECVAGSPLEDLDTDGWLHVLPSLLEVLDAMRGVELPGMGFGRWQADGTAPYSSWRDWLCAIAVGPADSRIHGWRERMVTIPGAEARFDAGYEKLTELVGACPEVRHVIHGDLTAANVLVESGEITAVLDWGNSIAGDPLYDLAWLTFWAPWHPGLSSLDLRSLLRERFDDEGFDDRLRCYELHIGLDAQQYNAFTSRWDELARSAERTLELAAS